MYYSVRLVIDSAVSCNDAAHCPQHSLFGQQHGDPGGALGP
jgi:hypothetical protein